MTWKPGLLISVHPADWRPALGWVYSQYQEYFDPQATFDAWDGVYASGGESMKDSLTGGGYQKGLRRAARPRKSLGGTARAFPPLWIDDPRAFGKKLDVRIASAAGHHPDAGEDCHPRAAWRGSSEWEHSSTTTPPRPNIGTRSRHFPTALPTRNPASPWGMARRGLPGSPRLLPDEFRSRHVLRQAHDAAGGGHG